MLKATTPDIADKMALLRLTAKTLNCEATASKVLDDPRFVTSSGAHHPRGHHYGDGGLLIHTFEVATLVVKISSLYRDMHDIDDRQLFLSALFHDYGKLWDYEKLENGQWTAVQHRRKIHHISRSNVEWVMHASACGESPEFIDAVSHNILSHHGSREHGSPVAPFTREAWILHLSDTLSARIDDCDRIDMVTINKNA